MRVAILSESPADEAALRILVDAVLGTPSIRVEPVVARRSGVSGVYSTLGAIIRSLHFRASADGLVVVVDSDYDSITGVNGRNCLKELRDNVGAALRTLKPIHANPPLRVAVGIAVPAIEAWLLCKDCFDVTEAAWENGLVTGKHPYTKPELKRRLYGTDKPQRMENMIAMTSRVAADVRTLEQRFPKGFGSLANDLRNWVSVR
jgi:hypothetical protein